MSAHVDPVALAEAAGAPREVMIEHLAGCAECRTAVARQDPSLLFGMLARAPIPEAILDQVSRGVAHEAGIAASRGGPLWEGSTGARRLVAAAVVAVALLTGLYALTSRGPRIAPAPYVDAPVAAAVEVTPDAAVSQVVDMTVRDTQVVMVYNGNLRL